MSETLNGRRDRDSILRTILKGHPGLRARINAKCCDCIYDPCSPGSWRAQVEGCSVNDCPLHPVRPRTLSRGRMAGTPNPYED